MQDERKDDALEQDAMTMNLELEDGAQMTCEVAGVFEEEGQEYIALIPLDDDRVLLYRYKELDGEEVELLNIESEEEFQKASDTFWELFGEEEFADEDEEPHSHHDGSCCGKHGDHHHEGCCKNHKE